MIKIELAETTVKLESMWRTRDGSLLPLSKMDDQHVMNSIGLLERQMNDAVGNSTGRDPEITQHNIEVLQKEMLRRGGF